MKKTISIIGGGPTSLLLACNASNGRDEGHDEDITLRSSVNEVS
jgi:hypothetical protein